MRVRQVHRAVALAVSAPVFFTLTCAVPAFAVEDLSIELPSMQFDGDVQQAGYHFICGVGVLREPPAAAPTWDIVAVGMRSTTDPIFLQETATGASVRVCLTIWKFEAPYGGYSVEFTYRSVPDDPASAITAVGAWTPTNKGTFVANGQ